MRRPHCSARPGLAARLIAGLAVLALAVSLGANAASAWAQEAEGPAITITGVESQDFPTVTAYVTVVGANGLPLVGLTNANFAVTEDGKTVRASDVVVDSDTSQRLSLVLAVDVSMNAASLAQIQSALLSFVGGLGPDDQVALLAYYDQVEVMADFTNDPARLGDAIRGLAAGGNGTAFNQAVDQAVNMLRDLPAGRKAVLTFTNSGDTLNNLSPEGTLDNAQAAGVRIYPFGFGPNINEELLNAWARFSAGQAYRLATAAEIQPRLETLGVLMRQSYKITFQSRLLADDDRHDLTITLEHQGQTAEASARFIAVPGEVVVNGPGLNNGQSVRGMVFLIADVTAPAPVEAVTFLLDGEPLAELTTPPYRFDWDTTTAGAGVHTLAVHAVDTAGNEASRQVSINVVLPPPVVVTPTAAPEPTAQPSLVPEAVRSAASSALRIGQLVLTGLLLAAGLLVSLLLWLRSWRGARQQQMKLCHVEVINQGNVRTRYELRAEDPTGALKFEFMLNDANLATQAAPAAPAARPAAPPKPAAAEKSNGHGGLGATALGTAHEKSTKALNATSSITQWMMNLSYMLPGRAGHNLRSAASAARGVQHDAFDVLEAPERAQRMAASVAPGKALPQLQAPAQQATQAAGRAAANPRGAVPGSAAETTQAAAPAAQRAAPRRAGWSLTPYVEPGGRLTVDLRVVPARAPKSQHYPFRVLSRAAEDTGAEPAVEHGSVALHGLPWHRRVLTPVLFVVMLVMLALLVWFLLGAFGVIGA